MKNFICLKDVYLEKEYLINIASIESILLKEDVMFCGMIDANKIEIRTQNRIYEIILCTRAILQEFNLPVDVKYEPTWQEWCAYHIRGDQGIDEWCTELSYYLKNLFNELKTNTTNNIEEEFSRCITIREHEIGAKNETIKFY